MHGLLLSWHIKNHEPERQDCDETYYHPHPADSSLIFSRYQSLTLEDPTKKGGADAQATRSAGEGIRFGVQIQNCRRY